MGEGAENTGVENAGAITYGKPSGEILQTVVYDACESVCEQWSRRANGHKIVNIKGDIRSHEEDQWRMENMEFCTLAACVHQLACRCLLFDVHFYEINILSSYCILQLAFHTAYSCIFYSCCVLPLFPLLHLPVQMTR